MFSAKDSLANLRLARHKRPERCQSSSVLPIDELRGHIAKKRQRTEGATLAKVVVSHNNNQSHGTEPNHNTATAPSATVSTSTSSSSTPPPKAVTFDLNQNTYQEGLCHNEEDTRNRWMTGEESEQLKTELKLSILGIQQGLIEVTVGVEEHEFSVRGLEAHLDPQLTEERIQKGRAFMGRILQQQSLLHDMMLGTTSSSSSTQQQMLAKLSATLSRDDAQRAAQLGLQDAQAALLIHTHDKKSQSQQQQQQQPSQPPIVLQTTNNNSNNQNNQVVHHRNPSLDQPPSLKSSLFKAAPTVTPSVEEPQPPAPPPKFTSSKDSEMISFLRSRRSGGGNASALAVFAVRS